METPVFDCHYPYEVRYYFYYVARNDLLRQLYLSLIHI